MGMHIILFGTGCDLCRDIAHKIQMVKEVCPDLFTFETSMDLERMLSLGAKSTPSLIIDGEVIVINETMNEEEIRNLCQCL